MGTLGVGITFAILALGVSRIFAVTRGVPLMERPKALAPHRMDTFSNSDGSRED